MTGDKTGEFAQINVEKLNIVDHDGTLRMALFNSAHMPDITVAGKEYPNMRNGIPMSGAMFYDAHGNECGGLIFGSSVDENGQRVQGLSLTFDAYEQDQVLQLSSYDADGKRNYGFSIYDRPHTQLSEDIERMKQIDQIQDESEKEEARKQLTKGHHQRAFMGRSQDGSVSVRLYDNKGHERIRLVIDANDVPKMEFIDADGKVIYSLPPTE